MKYYLAEASKNTFILFDCLEESTLDEGFLKEAQLLLEAEGRDDVLILMQGASSGARFYAHMAVWGLDGTFGEFCGNGARACAAYLFDKYPTYDEFYLVTKWGAHPLKKHGHGIYSIHIPPPSYFLNPRFITTSAISNSYTYVEVIEPHLVISKSMEDTELFALGQKLNGTRDYFPQGINVNAYSVCEDGVLTIKTYERGIKRLTQSCGSGSIACAACYLQDSYKTLQVVNPGGIVEVTLQKDGAVLKGDARYV
jgi:diaminopimelate epimerase